MESFISAGGSFGVPFSLAKTTIASTFAVAGYTFVGASTFVLVCFGGTADDGALVVQSTVLVTRSFLMTAQEIFQPPLVDLVAVQSTQLNYLTSVVLTSTVSMFRREIFYSQKQQAW